MKKIFLIFKIIQKVTVSKEKKWQIRKRLLIKILDQEKKS